MTIENLIAECSAYDFKEMLKNGGTRPGGSRWFKQRAQSTFSWANTTKKYLEYVLSL